jgi:hypothetical protein
MSSSFMRAPPGSLLTKFGTDRMVAPTADGTLNARQLDSDAVQRR